MKDHVIEVAKKIEAKIAELEELRGLIPKASPEKAITIGNYDKNLAKTMLRLRNDKDMTWEVDKVGGLPATLIEKVAKGIVSDDAIKKDLAETNYKSVITCLQVVQTEISALQTIYKYLGET